MGPILHEGGLLNDEGAPAGPPRTACCLGLRHDVERDRVEIDLGWVDRHSGRIADIEPEEPRGVRVLNREIEVVQLSSAVTTTASSCMSVMGVGVDQFLVALVRRHARGIVGGAPEFRPTSSPFSEPYTTLALHDLALEVLERVTEHPEELLEAVLASRAA